MCLQLLEDIIEIEDNKSHYSKMPLSDYESITASIKGIYLTNFVVDLRKQTVKPPEH